MVLAEPFLEGYAIPIALFKIASRTTRTVGTSDGMGLYDFIVKNVSDRIQKRDDSSFLSDLTDKHFFNVEDFLEISNEVGFRLEFEPYEDPSYYARFMDDLLNTYRITNPDFVNAARDYFEQVRELVGSQYAKLFPHFRFVIMIKPRTSVIPGPIGPGSSKAPQKC